MHAFRQSPASELPGASRPLLRRVERRDGFVSNLMRSFAESPAVLEGLLALEASLSRGSLLPLERQLVMMVVSAENGCGYCVAAHSSAARVLGLSGAHIAAVRSGKPMPDARAESLVRITRGLARCGGFVSETCVDEFLAGGGTRAELLEVVALLALKTAHNVVQGITATPLDERFESERWDAVSVGIV